ncbi:DUF438 domain-containing protein [Fredinandcohnia sp. QZ13]|uniref:DUF438 domain-containing protein n=1 Tax=Fredinandcohnia sp. QZ13 TaxID=3073144 RepID=UPI002852FA8B|nr:DUF438 domain-containing protein [Fredinandcohnia sp. QZ13]MDR4889518.1 DUF438 domain-containing protein [Fredinandcohnia sp. QZ13]
MSELINNREQHKMSDQEREALIKQSFKDLHNGKSVEEIKSKLKDKVGYITIGEVSRLQHVLMEEENIQAHEATEICTKHRKIFKDFIEETRTSRPEEQPGHPVYTFKLENRELEKLVSKIKIHLQVFEADDHYENRMKLLSDCNLLLDIRKHYERKEQLLFPYLEKYGIYGPTNMMWKIDDFIVDAIKDAKRMLTEYDGEKQSVVEVINFFVDQVDEMIYREENILFPMSLNNLTEDEWLKIAQESDEIGFCLISPEDWKPERSVIDDEQVMSKGFLKMETGILSLKQLELLLNHLPVDITFIDKDDVVRYFSKGKERIFARTKAVIGRTVQNCHPPRSVHVVEELLEDFKSGRKDAEDFWIKAKGKYVYIRYFAVRDEEGEYIGTMEFSQNIAPIQEIEGEKRILS